MVSKLLSKIFGSRNDRLVKRMRRTVEQINALEPEVSALSDDELRAKTDEFRQRYADGTSLDDLLVEAFAVVREAGKRALEMRHFDVQLIGGMVLNSGKITEMRTGEGKTLVATLAAYLNALAGKGVHVVTVNDYLASRDAEWMSKLYGFLGLSTGVVVADMDHEQKKKAYECDITYGTNNQFGFDYLQDNLAFDLDEKMQREHFFAVVDEVDSILIDEARTPLIISGPAEEKSDLYVRVNKFIPELELHEGELEPDQPETGDYTIDEKNKQAFLTERGHQKIEELLIEDGLLEEGESLYDVSNIMLMHHVTAALRAHALYQKDVDYIVKDNEIVIVDEFTGRTLAGRRWSEGLHQAIEAKEGVQIQNENQTLASITFQNYFRMYDKLSGMTGTADTEAFEFQQIYNLEVVVIPTNRPMVRKDMGDLIFLTEKDKYNAIAEDIKDCQQRGQPVLVGTTSIEVSEYLSGLLKKLKIRHEVLNAKQHEREAKIVAEAGLPGAVTIATNMAGRGTDIVLGGNLEIELEDVPESEHDQRRKEWEQRHASVLENGGLHIIGTERHESRRIDNQLRGRAGRQGDPGSSRFYLSLQDNLMRIFASDRVSAIMQRLGMKEGESIEHPWVSKAIENAQRKVEAHYFNARKDVLEYDDVANDQRKIVYQQRNELMAMGDISDSIKAIRYDVVAAVIAEYVPAGSIEEQWDIPGLEAAVEHEFGLELPVQQWLDEDDSLHEETLVDKLVEVMEQDYDRKGLEAGAEAMRHFEKSIMLQILDTLWKEHLAAMDHLRQGIHLRGYAQKNPKQEYKREAFEMFTELLERIKHEVITIISKVQVTAEEDIDELDEQRRTQAPMEFQHADPNAVYDLEADEAGDYGMPDEEENQTPFVRDGRKVGRNEPCPCGSGKKYKQCHGKLS